MLIDDIAHILSSSGAVEPFWDKLDCGSSATLALASSARPLLVAAYFAHRPCACLVVVPGEDSAYAFARSLASYLGQEQVLFFPSRTDHIAQKKFHDAAIVARRMMAAWSLHRGRKKLVVASASALARVMPPVGAHCAKPFEIHAGVELCNLVDQEVENVSDVLNKLQEMGYQNTGKLEGPGSFSFKGGVLDVYPGNMSFPVRIDFFGEEIEDVRRIVPGTGQTIMSIDTLEIYPVSEFPYNNVLAKSAKKKLELPSLTNPALRELLANLECGIHFEGNNALLPWLFNKKSSLGDYVHKNGMSVLLEPRSLLDDAKHYVEDEMSRLKGTHVSIEGLLFKPEEINYGSCQRASYLSIMRAATSVDAELPINRVDVAGKVEKLYGKLHSLLRENYRVIFSVPAYGARRDFMLDLVDQHIPVSEYENVCSGNFSSITLDGKPSPETEGEVVSTPAVEGEAASSQAAEGEVVSTPAVEGEAASSQAAEGEAGLLHAKGERKKCYGLQQLAVNITDVEIPIGMIIPKAKLALLSISDTQRSRISTRIQKSIDITHLTFPYKPGDYVVHAIHGIAYFKDIIKQELDGVVRDYLLLEYAEGDKLYVPVEQLDRVTRYVGPEGTSPRLTRLNTSDWSRALRKAGKSSKKLAFDLVDVYSKRSSAQGFAFSKDNALQRQMEETFPYIETPDQIASIADVKADMQSSKPMDRLVCGDVGFGKTEVALRAAFKAVQDMKQVMVLCPTTILAQQHFNSFNDRFEPFGIKVEVLSRFRTPAQQKAALEGFREGSVQVLVGTHRLLSRDVNPNDLGLIIVDEEQRFGVGHKEHIKYLKESIDVLTLSATPIPRTLQMSMSGIRDMSLILTPPQDRIPVKVTVGEWDADLVSAAIRREVQRGGQVYYVSNRVRTIDDAVQRVKEASEEVRVGVAHGQMDKMQLEAVMEEFSAGKLDVLVATTIIESGIDNPHTNTLIIEDAQQLGLSQMYQLKGRVGRGSTQAYAYFMFPEYVNLSEETQARLTALSEHQALGSGLRIAMRDLEIRGAGNLLGGEQSGNMSSVGFDLYSQMLANAVNAAREGVVLDNDAILPALSDIVVNIPGHMYFPEEYMPDADVRVLWYRKFAHAATLDDVEALVDELNVKYPAMPEVVEAFVDKARLRALAFENGLTLISVVGGSVHVEPIDITRTQRVALARRGGRYSERKNHLSISLKALTSNFSSDAQNPTMQKNATTKKNPTMQNQGGEKATGKQLEQESRDGYLGVNVKNDLLARDAKKGLREREAKKEQQARATKKDLRVRGTKKDQLERDAKKEQLAQNAGEVKNTSEALFSSLSVLLKELGDSSDRKE